MTKILLAVRFPACLALGLLMLQPQPRARAGRPMTIDDLISAIRVSDPQLSVDGRTVMYVRTTTNFETGARNSDIWAVAADASSAPRLLIGGEKTDNTPRG